MSQESKTLKFVQSALTHISFPETSDDGWSMIYKLEDWIADLDELHSPELREHEVTWTAPKWMVQGDILFFYCTKSTRTNIDKFRRSAEQTRGSSSSTGWSLLNGVSRLLTKRAESPTEMVRRTMIKAVASLLNSKRTEQHETLRLLDRAANYSNSYSGTIFGCAEVSSPPEYIEGEIDESSRFKSNVFAHLSKIHIFDRPLHADEFAEVLKIGQGAITPLHGERFNGVRSLLARRNDLPDFLQDARIGGLTFRDVTQENWPLISCNENTGFIDEAQIRAYLLDFLLNEVKDKRTPLLEECNCYRERQKGRPKIADYFMKVHGHWIPVEAKLNILAERNVLGQVAQYINIKNFRPTKGIHKGKEFNATGSTICLIVNQSGIYVTSDGEFSACLPGKPIWKREELDHSLVATIRDHIKEEMR